MAHTRHEKSTYGSLSSCRRKKVTTAHVSGRVCQQWPSVGQSYIQSIGRTDGRSVAQQSCPLGMPPSRPLLTLLFEDVWLNADATPGRKAMVMWEAR